MLGKPDYTLATVRRVLHGREGVISVVVTSASEDVGEGLGDTNG